ncbi:CRISPR-associated helicase Cas3' [Aeromonas australiensis]|uniref:CRISPR-associated helicase Cas3' n=1 Tax=Aeromonas australiensis TaxID=1114880 RepID=UPI001F3D24FA|nr:CRISPR-associated helicase Cas3' [Aeromonas australiensis]MCF3096524.1 CRISPR-associated helicase Cas3' [Aeromonas australiensis]
MEALKGPILFSHIKPQAAVLWAKSSEDQGHPLLAHMLDVAAVAEAILELEPASTHQHLASQFGLSIEEAPRWLATLVGLHDVGKAIPGFQAKWEQGQARAKAQGLTFDNAAALRSDRHDWASTTILKEWLPGRTGADVTWCQQVAGAVGAHHGYPLTQKEMSNGLPMREERVWLQARQVLLDTYWKVLTPSGVITADELALPAINWLAGLTSIADWIGSNLEWFPLGIRHDDLRQHYLHAKQLAHQALTKIGWLPFLPLLAEPVPLDRQLGQMLAVDKPVMPRALQRQGIELLEASQGPVLLLVEAPMGEGKTELAFMAHLHLQRTLGHRGFYLALPTQATGNALFARARQFMDAFTHGPTPDLQLIHGGAARQEMMAALKDVWGEGGKQREGVEAARWFSRRKRPLIAPYGVGTIDQALFSVLNVKHHFVRLWGLANRVVVLDEVHAYDTYTEGLIEAQLRWLKSLGCSVILMSATLPTKRRDGLLKAWQVDPVVLPELAYPRLVLADDRGLDWDDKIESREMMPVRLAGCGTTPEDLLCVALEAVTHGGCGAIIVNTVERAQRLYSLLKAEAPEDFTLQIFHARFPADERAQREAAVLSTFGKEGTRPVRALLVATQVVEQSLDIDFDFLVSDLAPIDLLLQRVGRLHRHQRSHRPDPHHRPVLTVAGLLPGELPDLATTRWRFVYDPYLLAMTWVRLLSETSLQLPQDIDRLVQAVYDDGELSDSVGEELRQYIEEYSHGNYLAAQQDKRQRAYNIAIRADADPGSAYSNKPRGHEEAEGEDMGLANCTRLGKPSVTVIPLYISDKGVALAPDAEPFELDAPLSTELACQLCARQLSLSNQALVQTIKQQSEVQAFAQSPLLRYSYPLLLDSDGRAQLDGRLVVRLDGELGLIYRNRE